MVLPPDLRVCWEPITRQMLNSSSRTILAVISVIAANVFFEPFVTNAAPFSFDEGQRAEFLKQI